MTITLPPDLESSIRAQVSSGYFPSEADMVAAAVRDYLRRQPTPPSASQEPPAPAHKPIWERIQDLTADVPDEEWDKLPTDLAEQHDHYIYGTPKRPST
jgi:Arc/MetJ-type ribon-helix-helix transcriptional regulator